MTPAARIAATIELLAEVESAPRRPADAVANDYFRARRFIGSGDRRAVSERAWAVLRRRRRLDWWLRHAGADVTTQRGMRINNSAAVLQAAIDGQGIALARSIMAHDDLAAGRLVRLFPEIVVPAALAYYVVYRPECSSLARSEAFRSWLFEEAEAARAASSQSFSSPATKNI